MQALVDDAAIFPPGNVPLDRAVAEHRAHRRSEYADLVGGFVISDVKLPDLIDVLDDRDEEEQLAINLVVTGGAGAIEPAVRWATRAPLLSLRTLEFALRADVVPAADLVRAATINGARLLRLDREIGAVKAGYRADLIVLDGNPLDDAGVLAGLDGRLRLVMSRGEVVLDRLA